jgi:hypothetical protein
MKSNDCIRLMQRTSGQTSKSKLKTLNNITSQPDANISAWDCKGRLLLQAKAIIRTKSFEVKS